MNDKVKLKDIDAEKVVVAGMLKNEDHIDKALLSVNPTYFTATLYRNLFRIITQVFIKHGSLITNEFLSNYLESTGIAQEARLAYLKAVDELKKMEVNSAEWGFAVSTIRKAFVANKISDILISGTRALEDKGGQAAYDVLDKKLYDLKLDVLDSNQVVVIDDRKVEEFLEHLKDIRENPAQYKGIPSGWAALDTLTGGFRPGEYILICAKSGGGKSMALLNWANHAQKENYNVVYFTLEMSHEEIQMRKLSLAANIPFTSVRNQTLTVEQVQKQEMVLREDFAKRSSSFYIVDRPGASVGFIEAQLRQLQKNMKIDAVYIDYFGCVRPEVRISNKQGWEVLAAISNDLRDLARSMKIVVCSAHQLNADGMKKKASEEDIEIEDVALSKRIIDPVHTMVGLIWDKTQPDLHSMKLCVPKCRGGRIQNATLWCDMDTCKISDPTAMLTDDGGLEVPEL